MGPSHGVSSVRTPRWASLARVSATRKVYWPASIMQSSFISKQPYSPAAKAAGGRRCVYEPPEANVVWYQPDRRPARSDRPNPAGGCMREEGGAPAHRLGDDQEVGREANLDGGGEAEHHARSVGLDGLVEELADLRKGDDLR